MIKTIDRYVAREFMRLFTLFALATPLLFILADWTDNIDTFTEKRLLPTRVALGYFYQMPEFIGFALPVAALIATVFTVNNMTRHSEMAAAKAGGISFFRALAVLPLLGVFLTIVGVALTELVPMGTLKRKEVMGDIAPTSNQMRHDFVYANAYGDVFTIRFLNMNDSTLGGLTMENAGDAQRPMTSIVAASGRFSRATGWILNEGTYRQLNADGGEDSFHFTQLRLAAFTETPDDLMARAKEPEEMGYRELGEYIETLQRSGGEPTELVVDRAQKLAIPAATLIIILFGAPLANSSARGGAAYGIGVSLGITIVYMMLFKLLGAAGAAGALRPDLAAWAPNVLFLLAAFVLISRVRT
jgi:lipopolysaccharide export system permease protein